jgi:hypothetical protein
MNQLLKFLRSNQAVLAATIMSLSTQIWHSVTAFVALDKGGADNYWNYLFGILFSVSTSFAILLFTVRGRRNLAYFFLAVEVFINIIHYSVLDMGVSTILFSTIFMCLIVPVTISVYSAEIDPILEEEKIIPTNIDISQNNSHIAPVNNRATLEELNKLVGFDVSNQDDYTGDMDPFKKQKMKDIWKELGATQPEVAKREINKLFKHTGKMLF